MKPQERYEIIEQFINGELSPDEHMEFQASMEKDPELAEEVKLHQRMHAALAETEVIQLENLLQEVNKEVKIDGHETKALGVFSMLKNYRRLAAIAAVLLVAALIFQLFLGKSPDLFSEHYESYPYLLDSRSTEIASPLHQQASSAYQNGEYESAYPLFITLSEELEGQPSAWAYRFYAGVSALEAGQYSDAEQSLKAVADSSETIYSAEAEWYLALVFLAQDKIELAKSTLENIMAKQNDRSAKAGQLRQLLD